MLQVVFHGLSKATPACISFHCTRHAMESCSPTDSTETLVGGDNRCTHSIGNRALTFNALHRRVERSFSRPQIDAFLNPLSQLLARAAKLGLEGRYRYSQCI